MNENLKILMVEDIPNDVELIKFEIKKGGISFTDMCVDSHENFINALNNFKPDIILSDYSLPKFNGMQALSIKEELAPSIPFILVTGSLNEETAIDIIKAGADDYVIKEHLARLCSAIKTAIEKKELVRSKIKAEKYLIASEKRFRTIIEMDTDGILIVDKNGIIIFANSKAEILLASKAENLIGSNFNANLVPGEITEKNIYDEQSNLSSAEIDVTEIEWDGELVYLVTLHDITERKKTEEKLKESEERLRITMEVTETGVWDWDLENDKWFASSMYYTMLGYDPIETESNRAIWLKRLHPDDRELVNQKINSVLDGSTSEYQYEARMMHADGIYRWHSVVGFVVKRNKEGKPTRMLGTRADITYRKKVEEELLHEQYLMRSLLDNTPDRIYFKDSGNRFIMINKSLAKRMNLINLDDAVGKTDFDFFTGEHAKQAFKDEQNIIRTGLPLINIEEKETWLDGSITWASTSKFPLYDKNKIIVGTMGISRNITESRRYADSLRESNEFNTSLIKTIPFGIDIVDKNGQILFMSEQFKSMFDGEVIGKYCWRLYRDDKIQCQDCPLKYEIKVGESSVTETENVLNGRTFQISHTGMIYQGKIAVLEIFQDITDRRKSEEKIRMLANALKSISECVSITDVNDVIFYVNESFLNTYGYTETEIIGKHIKILRPPAMYQENVEEILPQTIIGGWRGEIVNMKKDGTLFPVYLSTSLVKDESEKPIALIGVAIDITEIKKATEELILAKERAEKSDKLKSEFLAQVSHEINSPNVTLNYANIIREELGKNITPSMLNYFDGIESTGQRLVRTINLIINMSEMQIGDYKPDWTNINFVKDIIEVLSIEYSESAKMKNIEFIISNNAGDTNIYADRYSIFQIFDNLIDNAIKYTDKGKVEITIDKNIDGCIFVCVEDTGIGISDEFMKNMFEPFMQEERGYSRKYEGNGLGLALIKKYCDLNNAVIYVESKKGVGSKFVVTFKNAG